MRRAAIALAATAATAVATALPATAQAARAPTPEELTELAGATGPPSEPACVRGAISTVDERWAAVFATPGDACPGTERTWVLQRDAPGTPGNRWRELRQGIRFGVCAKDLPGIPDAVGVDLGVCAPPSARVYVVAGRAFAFKPRRLRYSRNATLTGLRWRGWGGAMARARGTLVYRDAYGGYRVAVDVTLSAIELCGSRRTYLGRRLAAVRRQDRDAVRAYAGRWYGQCPGVAGVDASAAKSAAPAR